MRSLVIILVTTVAFLGSVAGEISAQAPAEVKSFPAQAGDTLVIQNDYGRIQVTGRESSLVEAHIRKNPPAQAGKEAVRVAALKSGNKIFIYAFFSGSGGESVDLEIQVPKYLNTVIWGANPEIDLRGIQGYVRAQTFTGGVSAEDLVHSVSLISESGDIYYRAIAQPRGDARLETSSGNIRCELAEKLNLRAWLRAGGSITWDKEPAAQATSLEKQLGTFGPLVYAGSLQGNVVATLKDAVVSQTPPIELSQPREKKPEPPASKAPPPDTPTERPRLRRDPGARNPAVPADRIPEQESSTRDERSATSAGPPQLPDSPSPASGAQPSSPAERQSASDSPIFAVKVAVDSVFLNVSVRDRQTNRSIPNLGKADFRIFEDGVPQQIAQLVPTEAPFNLLLLLDVSGSTRSFLHLMKEASIDFTRQIKANDRVAIATFNSGVELVQDFTNDRGSAARAIQNVSSGGGTAFYDALLTCIDDYMRGIESRSAIVVFTDGVDNQLEGRGSEGSRTPFPQLYRRIQEIDPIIYSIFLDTEARGPITQAPGAGSVVIDILGGVLGGGRGYPRRYPRPSTGPTYNPAIYQEAREQLVTIAEQTGGRMYSPSRIEDLSRVYAEIADDLRIQYQLGYNSTNFARDGKWREIQVQVINHPEAVVRTRKGYYARKEPSQSRSAYP